MIKVSCRSSANWLFEEMLWYAAKRLIMELSTAGFLRPSTAASTGGHHLVFLNGTPADWSVYAIFRTLSEKRGHDNAFYHQMRDGGRHGPAALCQFAFRRCPSLPPE